MFDTDELMQNDYVAGTESMRCDICGREEAEWICVQCDGKMVCSDCDQKWHQHPRRRSHRRQLLRTSGQEAEFPSTAVMPSLSPFIGNFTRTSAASNSVEHWSAVVENNTVGKASANGSVVTTAVAGANSVPVSTVGSGSLLSKSREFSAASRQNDVQLLPRCIAEINADLSLQSMFGVKMSSESSEQNSAGGQAAGRRHRSENVERSNSRQFNSLNSDFQSTLQNLQSMMDEVGSSMITGSIQSSSSQDTIAENPNYSSRGNKQTEVLRSSASSGNTSSSYSSSSASRTNGLESRRSVVVGSAYKNSNAIDDELADVRAKTKYPPRVGAASLPLSPPVGQVKPVVSEQAASVFTKPHTVESQSSMHPVQRMAILPPSASYVTSDVKGPHTVESKGSVQRTADVLLASYDLPGPGIQTKPPKSNTARTGAGSSSAEPGRHRVMTAIDRQKSQTLVKQRLEDSPGVVYARAGYGNDLGVSERPSSGGSEPAYHSKFADIHDEVCTVPHCLCLVFG